MPACVRACLAAAQRRKATARSMNRSCLLQVAPGEHAVRPAHLEPDLPALVPRAHFQEGPLLAGGAQLALQACPPGPRARPQGRPVLAGVAQLRLQARPPRIPPPLATAVLCRSASRRVLRASRVVAAAVPLGSARRSPSSKRTSSNHSIASALVILRSKSVPMKRRGPAFTRRPTRQGRDGSTSLAQQRNHSTPSIPQTSRPSSSSNTFCT
mmetsp:Transcript_43869/g.131028  ORF Transcript_43869/g.131028 Transcript_43869/m.131028 type:complete len:212 (-) Transcript_43869:446-1081(-)